MKNINWFLDDTVEPSVIAEIISGDPVEELTVSKVYVPYVYRNGIHNFTLYNTDPQNWNLFMFPFEARKIRETIDSKFIADNATNCAAFVGDENSDFLDFSDGAIPIQAEIKFSKSTNLNTMYLFLYRVVDPGDVQFKFETTQLKFENINAAEAFFNTSELAVASNVRDIVLRVING